MSQSKEDSGRVIPMSPADAGRMSQGERLGKLENSLSRLMGAAGVISGIFTLFAVTIFTVFFSSNNAVIGLNKDMENLKTYIKEDRVLIENLTRSNDAYQIKVLKLESKVEYLEKTVQDNFKK